jgi:D-alanyl-lipoteichoic acid acyltransferase DltB (MBOAT superfamily)
MPQLTAAFLVFAVGSVVAMWCTPPRWRDWTVALGGVGLLLALDLASAGVFAVTAAVVYVLAQRGSSARAAGIALLVTLFCGLRWRGSHLGLALPIGVAFLVPRLVHYLLATGRNQLRPHGPAAFASWVFFFPVLLVGPLHRADTFLVDRARRRFDPSRLAEGLHRLVFGYCKVVLGANYLVAQQHLFVDATAFSPGATVLFGCVQQGLYLYLAFAGYSDIAIGLGRLHGHRIEENFDWPLLSRNLSEFWRAWHMTLSRWCRDHVFLPIYARTRSATPALVTSMVVLGLWHEFSLRFLLWGLWHGVGLAVHRAYASAIYPRLPALPQPVGRIAATALTLGYVVLSFVITKNHELDGLLSDLTDLTRWGTP